MKRLLQVILLPVILCSSLELLAQDRTITGKVTDSKDGSPLVGASVVAKGSRTGTSTNASGDFTITVGPSINALIITSVGFESMEVDIAGKTSITANLVTATNDLNAVVVIGYGTARKKDLTGAVSSVRAKDFNQGQIISPDQLLQGKVAGLEITSNSAQPGAATTVKIRGNNSIRANNNPLYVIDGVPLDGRTARPSLDLGRNGLQFGTTPESNPLLYINPADIAQIDVLKDASATAIYGSRGANGIIVITTKKGTGAAKVEAGVSYGSNIGYMKKFNVLDAGQYRSALTKYNVDQSNDHGGDEDALKAITQNTLSQNYSVAFSGGGENGRFRASILYSKNQGFLKKTSLDKYIGNFSGQYSFLDKKLSISFNLIGGHTTENIGLISNTAGAGGNLMAYALNWNPTQVLKTDTGYVMRSNSVPNPLAVIDAYNDQADVNVFLGNINAGYKITNDLEYRFLYAINHGAGIRKTSMDGWIEGIEGVSGSGFAVISDAQLTSQTFTHTLEYKKRLSSNLDFSAIAGYEYWKTDFRNSSVGAAQFNTNQDKNNRIPVLYTAMFQNGNLQYAPTVSVDPDTELQSYFGRVNFNLSDKYYLTATLRADGSSKFGANNKYGYFPSVGARWVATNEDFLKGNSVFNNLGVRASWGITGNQEFPSGAALEQFNSPAYNSIGQANVRNPNLKWEETTTINFGIDFSILNNKVFGSIDYYNKNTTNLLFQSTAIQPAPASVSYINIPAELINKGFEFGVGASVISKKDFSWELGFNIAFNSNKLTKFTQANIPTASVSGPGVSGAFAQIITNNHPVNEFYLNEFQGFDQNGLQIVVDGNPKFFGDPNPSTLVGFSNTLRYQKFTLTLNASGALGYKIYNNTNNTIVNIGKFKSGQNINADFISTPESINDGIAASSRYLEKGDYIKLRNARLDYNVGNFGKYMKNLNIFVSGSNLFVITKFTGFDPEVNIDKNNNNYPSRNMEYIPYPTPRVINFGLNFGL